MSTPPRHLVSVWNPSYAQDAMDAHLEVLLGWADAWARGEAERDDVYVWWAKLRSPNRQQPLPHSEDVLGLDRQAAEGAETHLYLTDYRSLYVAHVGEVAGGEVLGEEGERDHMPLYYGGQMADFCFRLWDIRRLVADDTLETIEILKRLRNVHYADRPVSLYGGMVNLPLVVFQEVPTPYFANLEALTEGRLWAERDTELRGETERMGRELRDNLLGREVWARLEPATRTFLSSAEATFRSRREDPRFDFSGPAVAYAKAVETELNALVFPPLHRLLERTDPREREARVDGRPLDLGLRVPHQSLGAIRTLLQHDPVVGKGVRAALGPSSSWLLGTLPNMLEGVIRLRNPAAHSEAADREQVIRLREQVLGIGMLGLIIQLARAKR